MLLVVGVSVDQLGCRRAWVLLGTFLTIVVFANWISLPFFKPSVHGIEDADLRLLGNWRGISNHKNIAAPLMFFAALYLIARYFETKRIVYWLPAALAIGFLIGTQSKTTIGFSIVGLALYCTLHLLRSAPETTRFLTIWTGLSLVAVGTIVGLQTDAAAELLEDPGGISGRALLWKVLLIHIEQVFLWGTGYGSFWRVGPAGPTFYYMTGWSASSYSGHNGYLDIFVTLGVFGFILSIFVFVISPLLTFIKRTKPDMLDRIAVAGLVFSSLHNLLETSFLVPGADVFLIWLICIATLREERPRIESIKDDLSLDTMLTRNRSHFIRRLPR